GEQLPGGPAAWQAQGPRQRPGLDPRVWQGSSVLHRPGPPRRGVEGRALPEAPARGAALCPAPGGRRRHPQQDGEGVAGGSVAEPFLGRPVRPHLPWWRSNGTLSLAPAMSYTCAGRAASVRPPFPFNRRWPVSAAPALLPLLDAVKETPEDHNPRLVL